MAIYHFTTKTVGRRNNGSTVAKAAYIARDRIPDKRTGAIKDYRKKGGLVFSGILLPKESLQMPSSLDDFMRLAREFELWAMKN